MTYNIVRRVLGSETYDCIYEETVCEEDFLTITAAVATLNEYAARWNGFSKVIYDDKLDTYYIWRRFNNNQNLERLSIVRR